MSKQRLDQLLVQRGLVPTRSQAESWIRLGRVNVDGHPATKSGQFVREDAELQLAADEQYVSRAGLKLASVTAALGLSFAGRMVLDVGSSTGGFTDFALQHGAAKVVAVDVGTDQLHPTLKNDARIELHEQTDIRNVGAPGTEATVVLATWPDIILVDVSFISLREILPHLASLCAPTTQIVAMLKPQFEAGTAAKHKGVIKNDRLRRDILKSFELWARDRFVTVNKADSDVAGAHGNRERFYLLKLTRAN